MKYQIRGRLLDVAGSHIHREWVHCEKGRPLEFAGFEAAHVAAAALTQRAAAAAIPFKVSYGIEPAATPEPAATLWVPIQSGHLTAEATPTPGGDPATHTPALAGEPGILIYWNGRQIAAITEAPGKMVRVRTWNPDQPTVPERYQLIGAGEGVA